jgi:hypothetical protein
VGRGNERSGPPINERSHGLNVDRHSGRPSDAALQDRSWRCVLIPCRSPIFPTTRERVGLIDVSGNGSSSRILKQAMRARRPVWR